MTSWMTEKDYRRAGAKELGIGLNSAFILEIKQDSVEFRQLMREIHGEIKLISEQPSAAYVRYLNDRLSQLRDEIETYFALEEFYGGFHSSSGRDISRDVEKLKQQHIDLFLQLDQIVDMNEQLVYHETSEFSLSRVAEKFLQFFRDWESHEEFEMNIVMRDCNEVLGTGD